MEHEGEYKKFPRMTQEIFDELLNLTECDIKKKSIIMPDPMPTNIKLAATVRFLLSGTNYTYISDTSKHNK